MYSDSDRQPRRSRPSGLIYILLLAVLATGFIVYIAWHSGAWEDIKQASTAHPDITGIVLAIIGIVLTVIGIIIGALMGISPIRILTRQQDTLHRLGNQISTHSVGLFPKHLTDIAKLVDDAKDSIDILADCVDYGSFIDPNGHKQLFDKIIEAKIQRGIRIRILVCGPPQPITRISNFYDNAPEQEKFQEFYQSRDKSFKSLYETYISMLRMDNDFVMFLKNISGDEQIRQVVKEFVDKRPRQNENGSPILSGNEFKRLVEQCILELEKHGAIKFIGDDEFTILLEIRQKWFENKLKGIGAIVEYAPNEIVPIFCWLKDNILDSVFVFSESVTKTRGMGFRTQDSDLVGIFHNIFENQWTALQR